MKNRKLLLSSLCFAVLAAAACLVLFSPPASSPGVGEPLSSAEASPEPSVRGAERPQSRPADRAELSSAEVDDVSPEAGSPDAVETPPPSPGSSHQPLHDHLKRSKPVQLEPALGELANLFRQDPEQAVLSLRSFDGEDLHLVVRDLRPHNDRAAAMTGEVEGLEMSFFSVAYVGNAQSGSIHLPSREQVFEIHPGPDGLLYLSEVDVPALGECGTCLSDDPPTAPVVP